ncbi:hypothetical protein LNP74_25530 [Klebsiella pneumoniae subsp. pneumoniae]|nr:hypothetical protein [Klebsiella pneumoniae subsp. pneumoniae]
MRERASRWQSVDAVIVNGGVARPGEILGCGCAQGWRLTCLLANVAMSPPSRT